MAPASIIDLTQDDAPSSDGPATAAKRSRHVTSRIKLPQLEDSDMSNYSSEDDSIAVEEDETLGDAHLSDEEEHSDNGPYDEKHSVDDEEEEESGGDDQEEEEQSTDEMEEEEQTVDHEMADEEPSRIEDTIIREEERDTNTITPVNGADANNANADDSEESDCFALIIAVGGDVDLVVGNEFVGFTRFLVDSAKLKLIPKLYQRLSHTQNTSTIKIGPSGLGADESGESAEQDRQGCNDTAPEKFEKLSETIPQPRETSTSSENGVGREDVHVLTHEPASLAASTSSSDQTQPRTSNVGPAQIKGVALGQNLPEPGHTSSQRRTASEQLPAQSLLGTSPPTVQVTQVGEKSKRFSFPGWCREELQKLDGQNSDLSVGSALVEPVQQVQSPVLPIKSPTKDQDVTRNSMTLVDQPSDSDLQAKRQLDQEGSLILLSDEIEKVLPGMGSGAPRDVAKSTVPTQTSSTQSPQIHLSEEDSEAVGIVMAILHSRFDMLPAAATFDTLYQLSIFCETFGTEDLVTPFARPWIERHLTRALEVGSTQWLYIAWVFKLFALFQSHLHYFVYTSVKDDEHLRQEKFPHHGCGESLIGIVTALRFEMLDVILGVLQQYIDEDYWLQHYECHFGDIACADHAYVAFVRELRKLGLWPDIPSTEKLEFSPSALREKLYAISITSFSEMHLDCPTLLLRFREDILIPECQLSESYLDHFAEPDLIGKELLSSQMGAYLYDYGWAPQDWGYTSLVKSRKRRGMGADLTPRNQNHFAMNDALSDDDDSDFEPEEPEIDELEVVLERCLAEEIDMEGQPPRKKARRNPPIKSREENSEGEHGYF